MFTGSKWKKIHILGQNNNVIKLKPIRFDGKLKGGSTKPWSVSCIDEGDPDLKLFPCVVKLFTPNNIAQSCHIAKEFICSELAREFDLDTPESYVIDLSDEDFVDTLTPKDLKELQSKHQGATFCSRLVNASLVNEELKKSTFSIWDCATLFAFDCMIMNADRGGHHNKANLLLDDDGFIVIDHELCLHFIDSDSEDAYEAILEEFKNNNWPQIYQHHLFYSKLKSYRGQKRNLFDTFREYLDRMDVNKIESLIAQLQGFGIDVGGSDRLIQYLYSLKQNSNKYCLIMLSLIA
ncbi:hypothetical protein OQY15_02675 [Pedobacter sp. MC2016-15]|uniref:HipA family kinase n=1 Tax=Pedobacter sp. MC2016-15 TaxID=2994473 RepID=UPI002246B91A|nr:HipA family kinase [Pedobacter sp. MC2016-15]MCX2477977.1 hypothetical protein [Pedobacter sp. MC2016-15]